MASGLVALVAAERKRVAAGEAGCGLVCPGCHAEDVACLRVVHPDTEDNRTPHVGETSPGGGLVQWSGPCPIPGDTSTTG